MTQISQAIIFAAGHATRMRPLTDNLPKPLLVVRGLPLLTHIIDHLIQEGVTKIIINGYHAIDKMHDYMTDIRTSYPDIDFVLSVENALLDTGGGAVYALDHIDINQPIYMINGDAFWENAPNQTTLNALKQTWSTDMDCLLLLEKDVDHNYNLKNNHAIRTSDNDGNYGFTGIRIFNPKLLKNYDEIKFSFLKIMDDCEGKKTLYGLEHQGKWYHISTPEDLNMVNAE